MSFAIFMMLLDQFQIINTIFIPGREDAMPQTLTGQWTLLKPNYKLPPPKIFRPSYGPESVGTAVEHDKSTSFPSTFILVLYKIDRRKIVTVTFWYKTQWVWKKKSWQGFQEKEKSHARFLNFQKRLHKEFCSIVNSNIELRKTSISVVVLPLKFSHCPTFLGIEGQTRHELRSVKINSTIILNYRS